MDRGHGSLANLSKDTSVMVRYTPCPRRVAGLYLYKPLRTTLSLTRIPRRPACKWVVLDSPVARLRGYVYLDHKLRLLVMVRGVSVLMHPHHRSG